MFKPTIKDKNGNEYAIGDKVIIETGTKVYRILILAFHENKLEYSLAKDSKQIGYIGYECIMNVKPLKTAKDCIEEMLEIVELCEGVNDCIDCEYNESNNPICKLIRSGALENIGQIKIISNMVKDYMQEVENG